MEAGRGSTELVIGRWNYFRPGLKENSGLAVHVEGLGVRPLRKKQGREGKPGDGNMLCVHSIDRHCYILIQIHWVGG
jgi:hypothetical protein